MKKEGECMKGPELRGAIFDLDGVITATARSHFLAWKAAFEGFLRETGTEEEPKFTYEEDYIPYVDGKPRYNGVQSFLQSRGIELPWGDPSDEPGNETICSVGNKKNDAFRETVKKDGVDIYDSTLKLIHELKGRGVKVGVASSSKNTGYVLKTVGLSDLFGSVVDGLVSAELGLKGKPEPDIFILAAERLGLEPKECMMVEDAYVGVEAGKRGNFALVLGVNREGGPEGLYARGADIVVPDLEEIDYNRIEEWFTKGIEKSSWNLTYYSFDPEEERLREALTTVGNGYIGTRGSYAGAGIEGNTHYPGTYIAGLYNRVGTEVNGKTVYNNDFVNCPNWTRVDCFLSTEAKGAALHPEKQEVLSWRQWLDMREAVTHHRAVFQDDQGREVQVETSRFISMAAPHVGVLRYTVTPLNCSAPITLRSTIDGDVKNYGVERYRPLREVHLEKAETDTMDGDVLLRSRTTQSKITVFMRGHHRFSQEEVEEGTEEGNSKISQIFSFQAEEGRSYTLEKIVWISTDRDWPIEGTPLPDLASLSYEGLRSSHRAAWERLWKRGDILIRGDRFAQRAARLHVYHLLTTASPHNVEMDTGFPARGLHGEAYRGHIFWDEIFIAPFFNRVLPEVTRSHLLYRYRRLNEAKEIAREAGFKGALYPWQSADTGERESQQLHYNPVSGEWDIDLSRLQRHISLAIAHNIWEYHYTTADQEFMDIYGVEMLLEIARFWADIAEYDEADGLYHISGVMGPDEFHERYPGTPEDEGGLKDNAYTNILVAWLLYRVREEFQGMNQGKKKELREKLSLKEKEFEEWNTIAANLSVVMNEEEIISQFDGFFDLKELDWNAYREKYGNVRRMDRILKAEGDSPDNYKLAKQADVLMSWFILPPREVASVLKRMCCPVEDPNELLEKNYEYYIHRTTHGSTLSYVVHTAILSYLPDREKETWCWFSEALKSDIYDTQGGTTEEGVHCGVMAGTLEIIIDNFCGLRVKPEEVLLNPELPNNWEGVEFDLIFRGTPYRVCIDIEEEPKGRVKKLDSLPEAIVESGETNNRPLG